MGGRGPSRVLVTAKKIDTKTNKVIGVMGPSGAGKTMLMKALCSLAPDFFQESADSLELIDAPYGLTYCAQDSELFPKCMAVADLVIFHSRLDGVKKTNYAHIMKAISPRLMTGYLW